MITPPFVDLPHGRVLVVDLLWPGGPAFELGHVGRECVFLGFFDGDTTGRVVGCDTTGRGVGTAAGGRAAAGVGFVVGAAADPPPVAGRGARATTTPVGRGCGSVDGAADAAGSAEAFGSTDGSEPGDEVAPGSVVLPGPVVGAGSVAAGPVAPGSGVAGGSIVWTSVGLTTATPPGRED